MGNISGEQWSQQQAEVWGDKDPDVFRRVVKRIQEQEPEVLRRVEAAIANGAPTHTVVWLVTNSILRGLDSMPESPEVEEEPEGRPGPDWHWDAFAKKWVEDGPKTGPAITPHGVGA